NEIDEQLQPIACGYRKTCPGHSTCCVVPSGSGPKHMCCPLKDGVCCEHSCCPSGYHCRPHGKCEKHAILDDIINFGY
ncbi:granulin, partial [Oesophagostomum dentatum]